MKAWNELGEMGGVLRNLRPGDVVWFKCHVGVTSKEIAGFREAMQETIDPGVTILVTEHDFFDDLQVVPLGDLLVIRDKLNKAILEKAQDAFDT